MPRPPLRRAGARAGRLTVRALAMGLLAVFVPFATARPSVPPDYAPPPAPGYRAFSADSVWNTPLPAGTPRDPRSDEMVDFLAEDNAQDGCVLLAGARDDPWGTPVYWAGGADPEYRVVGTRYELPPEFAELRIPRGARTMRAEDREMVVYDVERGYVAWLYDAHYRAEDRTWSAGGGSVAYLDSSGLEHRAEGSDERRNTGSHRGLNGAVVAARLDEVEAGAVEHVLRIGVRSSRPEWVWPMTGSDGTSSDEAAPRQGSRLRIAPSVDLSDYDLPPQALVIATALQRYGAVIGDTTGAGVELKLEDTRSEGRGQRWALEEDALCAIPTEVFEFVDSGALPRR